MDGLEEKNVVVVRVDGTQEVEVLTDNVLLENPLHFKTTSTGITVGKDVKDYPHVPSDWYKDITKQSHVVKSDWRYVGVKTKSGEVEQMRIGVHLAEEEVRAYSGLIEKFNNVFTWSYEKLKGISPEVVKHKILLFPGEAD